MDYQQMTVNQLKDLLRQRGLKISGNKPELIARLQAGAPTRAVTRAAMPVQYEEAVALRQIPNRPPAGTETQTKVYDINLSENPSYRNQAAHEKMSLSPNVLFGMALAADALLGPERDTYFRIYDQQLRPVNLNKVIQRPDLIILEGSDAMDLDGNNWLQELRSLGVVPTKQYTIRIDGPYGNYVLQFDDVETLQALSTIPNWLGQNASDYLRDFHQGSEMIDVDFS